MHYQNRLLKDFFPQNPDVCQKFVAELPYVEVAPGNAANVHLMTEDQWQKIASEQKMEQKSDYIKHLLNLHDGEIRILNDKGFQPQPLAWDEVTNAGLWPYQSARLIEVRRMLFGKQFGNDNSALQWGDVKWLVGKTSLWEWDVTNHGDDECCRLLLRQGNMITLSEVLWQAKDCISMYDAYAYYTSLPTLIASRRHSRSGSRNQNMRRHANALKSQERTSRENWT